MLPEAFSKRIVSQSLPDPPGLLKALEEPSPVSIRINTSKWNREPVSSVRVPWCGDGRYLESRPSFTLDPLFHAGCYYPQEASSMFLEQVYKQTCGGIRNIKVLDLCGAPGGKSTHLSSLIGENGFLVANEVIRQRSMILAENLIKWGESNFIVTQSDPSACDRLEGFFDLLVVDAPCSGEGMFREIVVRSEWSPGNCVLSSDRQKRILIDAWPALKDEGIMIYSTCTFNPAENEENISWFLSQIEAESVRIDISGFEGITEIEHKGIFGYAFYPGKIRGEGFFISALRKKSGTKSQEKAVKSGAMKISSEEKNMVNRWTTLHEDRIIKMGEEIFAVPASMEDFNTLLGKLKIVRPGTSVFSRKGNNFLPSHDLALSVRLKKNQFPSVGLDLPDAISYLRRDIFKAPFPERGWNLVTYKGVNLGFVNNIGSRFNNYYPVEWRIRMRIGDNDLKDIIVWDCINK